MMKHIFYGGAFDPLTVAHERIIKDLHDDYDGRLIVAVTNHDYKQYSKPLEWRLKMVREYCEHLTSWDFFGRVNIVVQDCRTWDFFEKTSLNVGTIVIGMDEWKDLNDGKWHHADELLSKYRFLVLPRTGDVSSTKVRQLISDGVSESEIRKYVSQRVYNGLFEK